MTKKFQLHNDTASEIKDEVRKSVLEVDKIILNITNNIVDKLAPPDLSNMTLTESMTAMTDYTSAAKREVKTAVTDTLISMLSVSVDSMVSDPVESPLVETKVKPIKSTRKHMPACTVRQIIRDRVDESTIHSVLEMHHEQGLKPSEIRAQGITLSEQIIQQIINDNQYSVKPSDPEPIEAESDGPTAESIAFTEREIKRMYKQGHTPEYICLSLEMPQSDVEALLPEIPAERTEPTSMTLELVRNLVESNKEKMDNDTAIRNAAQMFHLREDVVAHHVAWGAYNI